MDDLDKKIGYIFEDCFGVTISGDGISRPEEALNRIEQAFLDDGWFKNTTHLAHDGERLWPIGTSLWTGKQWYEKFCKELAVESPDRSTRNLKSNYSIAEIKEAAKKASGLNNEQGE